MAEEKLYKVLKGIRKDLKHHETEDDRSMREIARHEAAEGKEMKKRHHSTMRAIRHSSHHSEGEYAGKDERRRREAEDGHMISEDHTAIANMPQNVIMKPWPSAPYGEKEFLDDTIRGIDVQIGGDSKKKKTGPYPEKY